MNVNKLINIKDENDLVFKLSKKFKIVPKLTIRYLKNGLIKKDKNGKYKLFLK